MSSTWIETARAQLVQLRGRRDGWSYRCENLPCVEPTSLACLGLLGSGGDRQAAQAGDDFRRPADWIASLQSAEGSLGVSAALPTPGWATPYAVLLWAALGSYEAQRAQATRWLIDQEGVAIPNLAPPLRTVGHDTAIVGWPWVDGTHSWLEPTAMAILALRREGRVDHPRVREGLRLIRDRAIPGGGWNYGNNIAFGRDLRPQPAPTGLALLALAGTDGRSEVVERAIGYLQETLPSTRAPQSLCWGVLGLRAWGCGPAAARGWLAQACEQTLGRHDSAPRTAHLLLAAGERSLELLGLAPESEGPHEG